MALEQFKNTGTPAAPSTPWTLLDADIDAVVTTIDVAAATAFPSSAQYRILIGSEYLLVTAGAGTTTWTVTRGVEGSTAASHTAGAPIYGVLTAAALTRWPRSMTTLGDVEYLGASGTPTRLGAPSDGDYALRFTTGVPSYVAASGGTPGGSDTQVQFNDSGAFAGDAGLVYDSAVGKLTLGAAFLDPDQAADALLLVAGDPASTQKTLSAGKVFRSAGALGGGEAFYLTAYHAGAGSVFDMKGGYIDVENYGGGTATHMRGEYVYMASIGGTFGDQRNVYSFIENTASATGTEATGFYSHITHDGTLGAAYHLWGNDLAGSATNAYYLWFDSRGVYRIREDPLDGAGNEQAIPALYNPRFAKYTPGAADFERGVQQWVANVYQMGAEVGGTGTNRAVQIIGSSLAIPAASGTWNLASATLTLPTSQTITTPTIASFANAAHNHTNAAGGGQLALTAFASVTGSGAIVGATSPTLVTPTFAKVANLTGNGFVKTSGGDGTLSIDTATYLTTTTGVIGITIDGGGVAITTGVKGFIAVEKACTIVGWRVLSVDASATAGSIVIDVWKDTYANYPPTVADTIAASAKPTLSGVNKNVDTTLTGWTTSLAAGDVLGFNVDSATTVTKVLLELKVSATS